MIIKIKWSLLFVLLFLAQSCVHAGNATNSQLTGGAAKIIESAREATRKYRLTTIPESCLLYSHADAKFKGNPVVDVRERHGGKCGGDPQTSPRLFSIAIDRASGAIWSDARSLLGTMEKISK